MRISKRLRLESIPYWESIWRILLLVGVYLLGVFTGWYYWNPVP